MVLRSLPSYVIGAGDGSGKNSFFETPGPSFKRTTCCFSCRFRRSSGMSALYQGLRVASPGLKVPLKRFLGSAKFILFQILLRKDAYPYSGGVLAPPIIRRAPDTFKFVRHVVRAILCALVQSALIDASLGRQPPFATCGNPHARDQKINRANAYENEMV